MSSDKKEDLKKIIKDFPTSPGTYLMKNNKEKVIYVGKAKDLRARVRSYFNNNKDHSVKTNYLVSHIETIDYIITKTEVEAFLLEASLIKKHKPRYNIRLKDDKAYPYIRCSIKDEFPRFYLYRKVRPDGALYFGPYTSGLAVRETIKFLNRTFKVRDCSDSYMKNRKRPCITYQIGRCTAPCVKLLSVDDYRRDIEAALSFLRGADKKVFKELNLRMKSAAEEERFEAAAKIRDSIDAVKAIWQKQAVISQKIDKDQDIISFVGDERGTLVETLHIRKGRVIGSQPHFLARHNHKSETEDVREWLTSFLNQYYSENIVPDEIILPVDLGGEIFKLLKAVFKERNSNEAEFVYALDVAEKKLMELAEKNAQAHFISQVSKHENRLSGLEEIRTRFELKELPLRIECFDISNFQGESSVASQVVFEEGVPKRDDYRRYKIQTVSGANDFASMKEVLSRRFKHTEYEDPHLVVVDGGKGQLNIAVEVLKELGLDIPVVGLAKARTLGKFDESTILESNERFFIPGRQNPVIFKTNTDAYQILVGIRDEAHRFAISYHRKLRENTSMGSVLDDITGLGEKRKQRLLKKFLSVEQLSSASIEEIASLPTFNRVLAERILIHLSELKAQIKEDDKEEHGL